MSEYQYFEFRTIDRRLTPDEMEELRSYSTRARITPTSFVNDYSWGDFKGNTDTWMEKYFDAFLYLANWGTHIVKFRLPSQRLSLKTARQYCNGDNAFVRAKGGWIILSLKSEDEESYDWLEPDGRLADIIAVRNELIQGDLRALYIGWLLRAQGDELDNEDVEPPIPPGLDQLSTSLESLVDFLRIDRDLLRAAADATQSVTQTRVENFEARASANEPNDPKKDEMIADLVTNTDQVLLAKLLQNFIDERVDESEVPASTGRTVGDLWHAAEAQAQERIRVDAALRAKEEAKLARKAAVARGRYLDGIVERAPELWAKVESLIATRNPYRYDEAVQILVDLRDLSARGTGDDFAKRMMDTRRTHAHKPSLIQRLNTAGL